MEVFFNVQPSTTACTRSEAAGSHGSGVRTEPSLSAAAPQRGQTDRQTDRPTSPSKAWGLGCGLQPILKGSSRMEQAWVERKQAGAAQGSFVPEPPSRVLRQLPPVKGRAEPVHRSH